MKTNYKRMKRIKFLLLAAVGFVAAVSCTKESVETTPESNHTLVVSVGEATKATYTDYINKLDHTWEQYDGINAYSTGENGTLSYYFNNNYAADGRAEFSLAMQSSRTPRGGSYIITRTFNAPSFGDAMLLHSDYLTAKATSLQNQTMENNNPLNNLQLNMFLEGTATISQNMSEAVVLLPTTALATFYVELASPFKDLAFTYAGTTYNVTGDEVATTDNRYMINIAFEPKDGQIGQNITLSSSHAELNGKNIAITKNYVAGSRYSINTLTYADGDAYPCAANNVGTVFHVNAEGTAGSIYAPISTLLLAWSTENTELVTVSGDNQGLVNMNAVKNADSTFEKFPAFKYVHEMNHPDVVYAPESTNVWYITTTSTSGSVSEKLNQKFTGSQYWTSENVNSTDAYISDNSSTTKSSQYSVIPVLNFTGAGATL